MPQVGMVDYVKKVWRRRLFNASLDLTPFLVWDDFNRPDMAGLGTAVKGGAWSYSTGGVDGPGTSRWNIASGQVVANSNESRPVAWFDIGTGDLTVQLDMIAFNGPVFRMTDDLNFWQLQANGSTIRLVSVSAGVSTVQASISNTTGPHTLAVDARGTSIKSYRDAVLINTFTSSLFQTATRVGLLGAKGNGDKFDNFWVKP